MSCPPLILHSVIRKSKMNSAELRFQRGARSGLRKPFSGHPNQSIHARISRLHPLEKAAADSRVVPQLPGGTFVDQRSQTSFLFMKSSRYCEHIAGMCFLNWFIHSSQRKR